MLCYTLSYNHTNTHNINDHNTTYTTHHHIKKLFLFLLFTSSLKWRGPTNARTLIHTYVQLKKSQAVLTQAAERAAELLESKRMVDETGRRLKEKKEVLKELFLLNYVTLFLFLFSVFDILNIIVEVLLIYVKIVEIWLWIDWGKCNNCYCICQLIVLFIY